MHELNLDELLRAKPDSLLLQRLSQRLKALAMLPESASSRAEVELALFLSWWGLRCLAIKTIGGRGGMLNRTWLIERARRSLI